MNDTPRLRSAFPPTPKTVREYGQSGRGTASPREYPAVTEPTITPKIEDIESPLIPFNVLDAPSQRFYVIALYAALMAWRIYDWWKLFLDDTESLWLFMKWVALDSVFVYGVPGLRIPWLDWSSSTTTILFLLHAVLDGLMMFLVPVRNPSERGMIVWTYIEVDPDHVLGHGHDKDSVR